MKKITVILVLLILIYTGCGGDKNIKDSANGVIDIAIEQGGSRIQIINDTAEIRRSPFSLIFSFARPDSIFINASFKSETFNNASLGLPVNELIGFKNSGIDEEPYNRLNVLYVSEDTPNLWYYTDATDHRFNLVKKADQGFICQRDIASIIDVDLKSEKADLMKLKQNTIYLVILMVDWNEDYTKMIEKNRKIIRLKFII